MARSGFRASSKLLGRGRKVEFFRGYTNVSRDNRTNYVHSEIPVKHRWPFSAQSSRNSTDPSDSHHTQKHQTESAGSILNAVIYNIKLEAALSSGVVESSPLRKSEEPFRGFNDVHLPPKTRTNMAPTKIQAVSVRDIGIEQPSSTDIGFSMTTESFEELLQTSGIAKPGRVFWTPPGRLEFEPYLSEDEQPQQIPLSDRQQQARFIDIEKLVPKDDKIARLNWAIQVLGHVHVCETDRRRSQKAMDVFTMPTSGALRLLSARAKSVIDSLDTSMFPDDRALQNIYPWWDEYVSPKDRGGILGPKTESQESTSSSPFHLASRQRVLYHEALELMRGSSYERPQRFGLQLLMQVAKHTNLDSAVHPYAAEARYTLGMIYAHRGSQCNLPNTFVPYDLQAAHDHLEFAASHGHARAQYVVGRAYEIGDLYFPISTALSLHYYMLSARRGNPEAEMGICRIMLASQHTLGYMALDIALLFCSRAAALDDWSEAYSGLIHLSKMGVKGATETSERLESLRKLRNQNNEGSSDIYMMEL